MPKWILTCQVGSMYKIWANLLSFGTFCKNSFTKWFMSDLNPILIGDITNSKSMRFDLDDVPHTSTCIEENLVRKNGTKASNDEDFMCVAAIKSSSSKDDNDPSSSPPTWTNVTLTQRIFLIGLRMMCFDRFWWMWSIIVVCYWTCAFVIVHNYFLCNLTTILWIWVFDIHLVSKV